jgi:hypothetical protein
LRAPRDVQRRFEPAVRADRRRYAAIEAAYAGLIARIPTISTTIRYRRNFGP